MSKLSTLLQVTEEEKKAILKYYNTDEKEFEEHVQRVKDWVYQCEHLPHDNDDNLYKIGLLNCKINVEKTKQMIEGYYSMRRIYYNEFFDKLLPNTQEYMLAKRFVKTVVMPKLTPDLCRITVYKLSDPHGEATNGFCYLIIALMMAHLRIKNDMFISNIIIMDFDGYALKNLVKFTPGLNQKMVNIMNAIHLRIQAIHFVNQPNFIEHVMMLVRSFLPAKLVQKIHFHKTYESLYEHIPRECLPSNYEGSGKSIEKLYDEWCEEIEESEGVFKKFLEEKSTEKIELDPFQQDLFGLGVEGTFKKLTID